MNLELRWLSCLLGLLLYSSTLGRRDDSLLYRFDLVYIKKIKIWELDTNFKQAIRLKLAIFGHISSLLWILLNQVEAKTM